MVVKEIIFDFDGVIINSNHIKKESFFKLFPDILNVESILRKVYEEQLGEIKKGKVTRLTLIKDFSKKLVEKDLFGPEDIEIQYEKNLKLYSEIVHSSLLKTNEIPGAENALSNLYRKYNLHVLTTTPQENLEEVLKGRGLEKYFKSAYGAGQGNKIPMLKILIEEQEINAGQSILVGDGKGDYNCAEHYGIPFIGIINNTNDFATNPNVRYRLPDLTRLVETITKLDKK